MVLTAPAFVCTIAVEIQLTGAFYVDQLSIFLLACISFCLPTRLLLMVIKDSSSPAERPGRTPLLNVKVEPLDALNPVMWSAFSAVKGLKVSKWRLVLPLLVRSEVRASPPQAGCRQRVFRWCLFPVDIGVMKNIDQIVATINQGNDVFLLAAWIFRCFEGNVCSVAVILVKLQVEVVGKV